MGVGRAALTAASSSQACRESLLQFKLVRRGYRRALFLPSYPTRMSNKNPRACESSADLRAKNRQAADSSTAQSRNPRVISGRRFPGVELGGHHYCVGGVHSTVFHREAWRRPALQTGLRRRVGDRYCVCLEAGVRAAGRSAEFGGRLRAATP